MRSINNNAEAFHRMGNVFLNEEKFSSAVEAYKKALAICPESCATHFRLGLAYFSLKEFELAKTQFQTVLSLNHEHPDVNQCVANALLELGDFETATTYYFRQMEKKPWFETYYNLGVLFMMKDHLQNALLYFNKAVEMQPDDVATQLNLGNIYLKKNNLSDAITAYENANRMKPDDPEIQHILSALKQRQTPDNAPKEYVTHLFDQYAPYYDFHLTEALKYDTPQKILQTIQLEYPHFTNSKWSIVDLGCGTGLCGSLFKPFADKLIGIDLSENMLAVAKQKNIYDALISEDVAQSLTQLTEVDLIVAADVFTYCGNLEYTFKNALNTLKKNGLFVFTVEKTHGDSFILQTSIRYAHSKYYLEKLITDNAFEIVRFDNIVLRKQKNEPVEGYLVLLKKP
jgi:predicted TPR repeat methyltransferase